MKKSSSLVYQYFSDIWTLLTRPSEFFEKLPPGNGVGSPLAFALITHWLGSAISFLWSTLFIKSFGLGFLGSLLPFSGFGNQIDSMSTSQQYMQMRDRVYGWIFGAGPVVLDPFLTLIPILISSVFVYAGARLLVSPRENQDLPSPQIELLKVDTNLPRTREVSFQSAVQIVCYGMTPSILAAIPLLGGTLASLGVMIVTVIGAKTVYQIKTGRAICVALFPKLLIFGLIMSGLVLFSVVFLKLISAFLF